MRIATRGSALALTQARAVADALPGEHEIVEVTTAGDRGALPGSDNSHDEVEMSEIAWPETRRILGVGTLRQIMRLPLATLEAAGAALIEDLGANGPLDAAAIAFREAAGLGDEGKLVFLDMPSLLTTGRPF